MSRRTLFGLISSLLLLFPCHAKVMAQVTTVPAFTIKIEQPAYTGEPVWVRAVNGPIENVRYPVYPAIGILGCNRLEVMHEGRPLAPRTIPMAGIAWSGPACASSAPAGSPRGRLPLHVLFPMIEPGSYSVRWTIVNPDLAPASQGSLQPVAESHLLTFTVAAATPEQHEIWLRQLLNNPPDSSGLLAGDFLPSLAAAAPDPRALAAFLKYLYADDQIVAAIAASALELFPQSEVMRAVVNTLQEHGPSDQLAYYVTYHRGWTVDDEVKIVHAAAPYLQASESSSTPELSEAYVPTKTSSALKLLMFIFYLRNQAWPPDPALNSWTDAQVLKAAPDIIANANMAAVQELAEYLGSMQPSTEAHALLLRIARRGDTAGRQAEISIGWHRPG